MSFPPVVHASPVERVLSRLEAVRQVGARRWIGRCPAHADTRPSLSVHEADDGKALVHCFAGCSVDEICRVLGLEVCDLYPPRKNRRPWKRLTRREKPAPDPYFAWDKRVEQRLDAWYRIAFLGIGRFHGLLTRHAANGPSATAAIESILARLYDLEQAAEMAVLSWDEKDEAQRREMFARGELA